MGIMKQRGSTGFPAPGRSLGSCFPAFPSRGLQGKRRSSKPCLRGIAWGRRVMGHAAQWGCMHPRAQRPQEPFPITTSPKPLCSIPSSPFLEKFLDLTEVSIAEKLFCACLPPVCHLRRAGRVARALGSPLPRCRPFVPWR